MKSIERGKHLLSVLLALALPRRVVGCIGSLSPCLGWERLSHLGLDLAQWSIDQDSVKRRRLATRLRQQATAFTTAAAQSPSSSTVAWINLSRVLAGIGRFSESCQVRAHVVDAVSRRTLKSDSKAVLHRNCEIAVALETVSQERLLEVMTSYRWADNERDITHLRSIGALATTLGLGVGQAAVRSAPGRAALRDRDAQFRNLVSDRDVALVAPGVVSDTDRCAIGDYQVVVSLKSLLNLPQASRRSATKSRSVHLLYVRRTDLRRLSLVNPESSDARIALILTDDVPVAECHAIPASIRPIAVRVPLLLAPPLAGSNVLLDLLDAGARTVGLFGFDLYSQAKVYDGRHLAALRARKAQAGLEVRSRLHTLFRQDLIGEYRFMRNVVGRSDRVIPFGCLSELLAAGEERYVSRVDALTDPRQLCAEVG